MGHFITANKKRGPKVNRSSSSPTQCLDLIHNSCNHTNMFPTVCASCVLNCARVEISKLTKQNGKKLGILITELVYSNKGVEKFLLQYYDAIIDMINSKFFRPPRNETCKKSKPKVILPVFFSSKLLEQVGIARILREEVLQEALPEDLEIKAPTLVFKYSTTI